MKRSRLSSDNYVLPALPSVSKKHSTGASLQEPEGVLDMPLLSNVAAGRCFCLAIADSGKVTTWGKNTAGQMGLDDSVVDAPYPQEIDGLGTVPIVGVACGNFHAFAVNELGEVFAWGSNARGRLGIGRGSQKEVVPVMIPPRFFRNKSVVSVGCGLHHSIFLLDDGSVMSAGCNENGQLGRAAGFRNAQAVSVEPQAVSFPYPTRVCRIASGRHHCLALSSKGELFGWGKNDTGQLGLGTTIDSAVPVLVGLGTVMAAVRIFDAGRNHSVVATVDDKLWVFGQNVDGQLGFRERNDILEPRELDVLTGIPLRQIACGSRHTTVLTKRGHMYSWGWLLDEERGVVDFRVEKPYRYSDKLQIKNIEDKLASVSAGSTHMMLVMKDGTVAILGENPDRCMCRGPQEHPEKAFPPVLVTNEAGSPFKVAPYMDDSMGIQDALARHLMKILVDEFDTNVTLRSPNGDEYKLHRVVLAVRCPELLDRNVPIPVSPRACKQLFEWIYGQRCNLAELSALELVQLVFTVGKCHPHLGQLAWQAERTFVHLIRTDKEENLLVTEHQEVMDSFLGEWVKNCLSEHLRLSALDDKDLTRVPAAILSQVAIASHKSRKMPVVAQREEQHFHVGFLSVLETGAFSDFEIRFIDPSEPPLQVHACIIARMAFFEALLRNISMGAQGRVFTSQTPRSAMIALLRYIYGGVLNFTPWDALYLMSPEHGVMFYFAATAAANEEVEHICIAMQHALAQMPIRDAVGALVKAQDLGIHQAEDVLVDLIADHFTSVEDLLEGLCQSRGTEVALLVHKRIIYSLLNKVTVLTGGRDPNESMGGDM